MILTFFGIFTDKSAYAESADDYNTGQIAEALPDAARERLEGTGITPDNSGALGLTFGGVLSGIWDMICDKAAAPLKMLCSLTAVVLFCAMARSFTDTGNLKGVFSAVSVLCGAGVVAAQMNSLLNETLGTLSAAANFMMVFIPVMAGIAAVLGYVTSATAVNSAVLAATQLFSQLAVNFLAPLCGAILGMSVAGAVSPDFKLDKLGELVKKFVVWGLSLIMTVFAGVLSTQTLVSSSADNAAIKTAKFAVSQGIPIVGGTISDTVNTLSGGLEMLKGSVGSYGLIAAVVIILPTLITLFGYKIALVCAEALAEMFALKELSALFKSCCSIMTIIIAVTFCFLALNTIAGLMMFAATHNS